MKTIYFKNLLVLVLAMFVLGGAASAQVCQVDSAYNSPGIYPSDTLADMTVGLPYNEVVQFVFPADTTVFGFTVNFDSFVVANVTGIPPGINWECNANHPTCHYICSPPALTRGCVKIYGTSLAASPAYPGYDSIIVTGQAWVTIPFTGPQSFNQDIPVYYRSSLATSSSNMLNRTFNLQVRPNPVQPGSSAIFNLPASSQVAFEIHDIMGNTVAAIDSKDFGSGLQEQVLPIQNLSPGIYFVTTRVNGGSFVATQKFQKLN